MSSTPIVPTRPTPAEIAERRYRNRYATVKDPLTERRAMTVTYAKVEHLDFIDGRRVDSLATSYDGRTRYLQVSGQAPTAHPVNDTVEIIREVPVW